MPSVLTPPPSTDSSRVADPAPRVDSNRSFRWILPLLGIVSLLVSCVLWSRKKPLSGDELFTHVEISDPSLAHLMHAALHLGGAGMPLFYFTAWIWAHLFGLTDLSLRLYSSISVCAAFLVLFVAIRRRFTARAAFLGVAFGLFACLIVIDQNVEARGYGLYLLLAALAVSQALKVAETPQPRPHDLVFLALTQAGLVLGHVLGVLYGGLILAALIMGDRLHQRFRTRVYLSCVAGWLALVPWIPAIQASAAVGKPHSWIAVPTISDLAIGLSFWLFGGIYFPPLRNHPLGLAAGWGCAMICVIALLATAIVGLKSSNSVRRPTFLIALALLSAPVVFFAVSHIASPIYVARYMIPSALGIAMLAVCRAEETKSRFSSGSLLLAFVFLLFPVAAALLAKPATLDVARIDAIAAGRPIVCPWLQDFLLLTRYSADPAHPQYPLDENAALRGPAGAIGGFHLMSNYRSQGYLTSQIIDAPQILGRPTFLVLDDTDTNWFSLEIANQPRFTWKVLAQIDPTHRLIEVASAR
ncbi:MAG TPA: glycosyltransferase family 39 protein [Acidobacteriaceae bacterium]|jgi:4-amino-4-deoxy-L-arabinose transferase-like glycosyltransferase|nr:glycosyltransferase family 39 protein [Acidobacteriaceae bacterium]